MKAAKNIGKVCHSHEIKEGKQGKPPSHHYITANNFPLVSPCYQQYQACINLHAQKPQGPNGQNGPEDSNGKPSPSPDDGGPDDSSKGKKKYILTSVDCDCECDEDEDGLDCNNSGGKRRKKKRRNKSC